MDKRATTERSILGWNPIVWCMNILDDKYDIYRYEPLWPGDFFFFNLKARNFRIASPEGRNLYGIEQKSSVVDIIKLIAFSLYIKYHG